LKAVTFDQPGDPDVLSPREVPAPQPADGELLIRVRCAALNRADLLQRRGTYPPPAGASSIPGLEIAGEVVEGAGKWKVGDRVMAVVTGGGYAEYCVVPASVAMPVSEALSDAQAAAIPEAFLTAYLNLFWLGKLQPGESVLIHAGASGVGTAAIQLARQHGSRIFVTAGSPEKLEFCRELGADVAINRHDDDFADVVLAQTAGHGVDVVIDFVGAAYWNAHMRCLAVNGRLMIVGSMGGSSGQLDLGAILPKSLTIAGTTLRRMPVDRKAALSAEFAATMLLLFDQDVLRPVIDSVYPLAEAAAAHRHMESNANTGKIILQVG